jgi:hypothetical protein
MGVDVSMSRAKYMTFLLPILSVSGKSKGSLII